jgi:AraC-like DNA-binding protein
METARSLGSGCAPERGVERSGRMQTVRGETWSYTSWTPPALAPYVDHLWGFEGPTAHTYKRVFPNGCIELLLNFSAPYRERGATLPHAWVSGALTRALVVEQPARQHCLGARLRPAGAYMLLARPLREVTDLSIDLADLVGDGAHRLVDRCAQQPSIEAQLRVVAAWLDARFAHARALDRRVAWAAGEIEGKGGAIPISDIQEKTGLSKPRLRDAFRDQIGVAPKLYGRIVRFRRTLAMLQHDGARKLSDVAFDAQFYDQPHMNAEFRALGGMTPREFLAARHPVGDGSTAADL